MSDLDIARKVNLRHISEVANQLGISEDDIENCEVTVSKSIMYDSPTKEETPVNIEYQYQQSYKNPYYVITIKSLIINQEDIQLDFISHLNFVLEQELKTRNLAELDISYQDSQLEISLGEYKYESTKRTFALD